MVLDTSIDSSSDPYTPLSWEYEDLLHAYGARPTAFVIDENSFKVKIVASTVNSPVQLIFNENLDADLSKLLEPLVDASDLHVQVCSPQCTLQVLPGIGGSPIRLVGVIGPGYACILVEQVLANYFCCRTAPELTLAVPFPEKTAAEYVRLISGAKSILPSSQSKKKSVHYFIFNSSFFFTFFSYRIVSKICFFIC